MLVWSKIIKFDKQRIVWIFVTPTDSAEMKVCSTDVLKYIGSSLELDKFFFKKQGNMADK